MEFLKKTVQDLMNIVVEFVDAFRAAQERPTIGNFSRVLFLFVFATTFAIPGVFSFLFSFANIVGIPIGERSQRLAMFVVFGFILCAMIVLFVLGAEEKKVARVMFSLPFVVVSIIILNFIQFFVSYAYDPSLFLVVDFIVVFAVSMICYVQLRKADNVISPFFLSCYIVLCLVLPQVLIMFIDI